MTPRFERYHGNGMPPAGQQVRCRDLEDGRYLADDDLGLRTAVNTALAVSMPLLVSGEPGTGKSTLAWSIATELGLGEVLEFLTRSDHVSRDVLYSFDHLRRLFDAQTGDPRAREPRNYLELRALGAAIASETQRVVLIDEIDKAPRDFPNDLLNEIERSNFVITETSERYTAKQPPVVVITSNSERELPDAFLRRCIFHHIEFPRPERLVRILRERLGHLNPSSQLCIIAVERFNALRLLSGLERKPGTAELINWVSVLIRAGIDAKQLDNTILADLPFIGALLKKKRDHDRLRMSGSH